MREDFEQFKAELGELLKGYGVSFDGNTLTLSCICDGTYIFLFQMVNILTQLGFEDIETGEEDVESPHSDKPWLSSRFWASGKLRPSTSVD